ncbi:Uncharacterized protein PCOAH_00018380 [Plasmodium coatneyi]|uniref:Apicoplast integral membrane protein n=1 Tax=Plasmodium coatneyi TaxID=208452 RepID=A0A1B1DXD2_9APIC|nr:Uncharacterized protein PCOAH_00018380 [Plasmodium coatneyi]ANQ07414.1 Uncharacterized protein PCOAH_00018380 [Plasmodium coatneyi]
MKTFARLILLLLALLHLAKSQFSKDGGRGGIHIRQYHVGEKCFIRVSTPNKRYRFGKNSRVVKKFKTSFSRKDVQNVLRKIPQINYPLLSSPLGVLLRLSNVFSFMLTLNALKLIRSEHRTALTEITDNICSKIFLLNAINDVVRKIPEEAPQLGKISLFCVAQFFTQIFFSRVTAYLFYAKWGRGVITGRGDKERVQVEKDGQGEHHLDGEGDRVASTAGVTAEEEQETRNPTITTDLNCRKITNNEEEAGREQKINMLQHMCVLNQSGLIPMFVYNNLLKMLHWEEKNISLFVNCYVLISGILTKLYVKFFVKKKKKEEISSDEMKSICLSSMFSSILRNSYFYFLCTSIFFKIFAKANAFYEQSIKQATTMFNTMLTPSVYVILSNILYEGIKFPSPVSFKDLLFVLQNKYLLFPSLIWAMLHVSSRYGVFKFDKNLQLYFLIQAMTPPSYNLFLLAKNYGEPNSIRKILSVSYPLYLVALYFYALGLFSYFRN